MHLFARKPIGRSETSNTFTQRSFLALQPLAFIFACPQLHEKLPYQSQNRSIALGGD
jgi:hypothetical protein